MNETRESERQYFYIAPEQANALKAEYARRHAEFYAVLGKRFPGVDLVNVGRHPATLSAPIRSLTPGNSARGVPAGMKVEDGNWVCNLRSKAGKAARTFLNSQSYPTWEAVTCDAGLRLHGIPRRDRVHTYCGFQTYSLSDGTLLLDLSWYADTDHFPAWVIPMAASAFYKALEEGQLEAQPDLLLKLPFTQVHPLLGALGELTSQVIVPGATAQEAQDLLFQHFEALSQLEQILRDQIALPSKAA